MRAILWFCGFVGCVLLANWLLVTFGIVTVLWMAMPAGVFAAGLSFSVRDGLHDAAGWRIVMLAIVAGSILSAFLSPSLALASGAAFLISESLDLAVYTPLRESGRYRAVGISNVVGAVADSAIFLALGSLAVPFLSMAQLPGQVVGKLLMTALALVVMWGWQRAVPVRSGERLDAGDAALVPAGDNRLAD